MKIQDNRSNSEIDNEIARITTGNPYDVMINICKEQIITLLLKDLDEVRVIDESGETTTINLSYTKDVVDRVKLIEQLRLLKKDYLKNGE
jgi:sporulation protein YlmC with PRC-barrel domain